MAGSSSSDRVPVAIVGGGPVGLSLALGLARHGVRSVLVERKETTSTRSKAPFIQVRTREVFRQWGIEDRFLAAGTLLEEIKSHSRGSLVASVDYSVLDDEADHPGLLVLEQARTEKLLLEAVLEAGLCDIRFATEATALEQHADGVHLKCRDKDAEYTIDAEFVAGCDGAGSFTREVLGLPFDGSTYSLRPTLADVRIDDKRDELPWPRIWNGRGGLTAALRLEPGLWRLIRFERGEPNAEEAVPESETKQHVGTTLGPGPFEVVWASRFRIHLRSAPTFRIGRVLLAGDAAHIHSPAGAFGMNGGIQDAHNLAWKLAAALDGGNMELLLDSYDVERRAVTVETFSIYADFLTRMFPQSPAALRTLAFRMVRFVLAIRPVGKAILRRLSMIGIAYDKSPLLPPEDNTAGKRLPNPMLRTPDGREVRLYDLAPNAAFLLNISATDGDQTLPPVEHVIRIGAGALEDPSAILHRLTNGDEGWILVRPDRHIAWTGASCPSEESMMFGLGLQRRRTT